LGAVIFQILLHLEILRPLLNTATASVNTPNKSFPPANSVSDFDLPQLLHISPGLFCSPGGIALNISNTLVLSTDRLTYDSNEIQQMKASLTSTSSHLPPTLQWVSGNLGNCEEELAITNIATTTIQISQINIRLMVDAQPNRFHYHLINTCSVANGNPNALGCTPGAGQPRPYASDYSFSPGKANTVFSGHLYVAGPGALSSLPTLNPGGITYITLTFTPKSNLESFIYTITPEIVLNTGNTVSKVNLPQLSATIAFANAAQFTCYNLQGDTFVPTKFAIGEELTGETTLTTCV
jgi:hypothetical protein